MTANLELARKKIITTNPSTGFPGREDKISDLETFLMERLKVRQSTASKRARIESGQVADIRERHSNKTMFVCGVPGTGKTAIVRSVIDKLARTRKKKDCQPQLHPFQTVYINSQHLSAPQKVYSEILLQLKGLHYPPEKAQDELNQIFRSSIHSDSKAPKQDEIDDEDGENGHGGNGNGTRNRRPTRASKVTKEHESGAFTVLVIDELDLLFSERRQTVFYSLFDWPSSHETNVILITIANAMDLPDKFMRGRIGSRLGCNKLVFEPYTSSHLELILEARLGKELLSKCFDGPALRLATMRIGKTTGDARRIIDTCCLAIDEAIAQKKPKVTSAIVDSVGFGTIDKLKSDYLQTCTPLELLTLKGILREAASHGEDNIITEAVFTQVEALLKQQKHLWLKTRTLCYEDLHNTLVTLQACGMINFENAKPVMKKQISITDTSETFRDLIRNASVDI